MTYYGLGINGGLSDYALMDGFYDPLLRTPTWKRQMIGLSADSAAWLRSYDTGYIQRTNSFELGHLGDELDQYRDDFLGIRWFGHDDAAGILGMNPAKVIGIVNKTGQMQGDPAARIKMEASFFNFGIAGWRDNEDLYSIARAAVKQQDARVAAMLVREACNGWGASTDLLNIIFKKPQKEMNEPEYNRFIVNVVREFGRQYGENLSDYFRDNYSRFGVRRAIGLNIFGTHESGQEFLDIILKANKRNENSGMGMLA